jgi:polyisoprenoid-binding protein YceI
MLRYLLLLVTFCWLVCGFTQTDASISFVIKNVGINVDGHFNTFEIKAVFDSAGNLSSVRGNIEVASIETGIESRDEHLLKDDYFNVKEYPNISLKSYNVKKKTNADYAVEATVSIKGITKNITIPIRVEPVSNQWKLQSNFEINRRDFDVGGSSFVLSKTVKINVIHYQRIK